MREYQKELLLRALTRHDWTPAMDSHLSFDSQLSAQSQALVAKLLEESRFAPGGVGHAGTMSRGKTLTRQLSHRPDAVAAFDWLANQRIPVSQLHACGALRTLAPSHARVHATELVAIAGR